MRLWSLHPRYLDVRGLVAAWREALLARAVLRGETVGYTRHPQLERFRAHPSPRRAIDAYLAGLHAEATARGYAFDRSKFRLTRALAPLTVTDGQLQYEWVHLLDKLAVRDPARHAALCGLSGPECHALFHVTSGPVASWERTPSR